jgi:hypothetical protein
VFLRRPDRGSCPREAVLGQGSPIMVLPPLRGCSTDLELWPPPRWGGGMQRLSGHCWLWVVVDTFEWVGATAWSFWKAATPMAVRPPTTTTAEAAARATECGKWC